MILNNIKQGLIFVFNNAALVDYLAYGWVCLAFVLMFLVGIFCAIKWSWILGVFVIFFSFFGFFVAIYFTNLALNKMIRGTEISEIVKKQLEYSNALVVDFNITNRSKKELKICKTELKFYANSKNFIKNQLNQLSPFLVKTIILKEPFLVGEPRPVSVVVDNFSFSDYTLNAGVECF